MNTSSSSSDDINTVFIDMPDAPLTDAQAANLRPEPSSSWVEATFRFAWNTQNPVALNFATESGSASNTTSGKIVLLGLMIFSFLAYLITASTGFGLLIMLIAFYFNQGRSMVPNFVRPCWDALTISVVESIIETFEPKIKLIKECFDFSCRKRTKRAAASLFYAFFCLLRELFSRPITYISFVTIYFIMQHNDLMLTFNILNILVLAGSGVTRETDPRKIFDDMMKTLKRWFSNVFLDWFLGWLIKDEQLEDHPEDYDEVKGFTLMK